MVVLRLELPDEGGGGPRIVAGEQLRLQFGATVGVADTQRAVGDGHEPTRSLAGLASGRRRYSGIRATGSVDQSTARTKPDAVG